MPTITSYTTKHHLTAGFEFDCGRCRDLLCIAGV
jgi:hypothetical protein